MGKDRLL